MSRSTVRFLAAVSAAVALLVSPGAVLPAPAATGYSRAQLVHRAKALAFHTSLAGFVRVKTHARHGIDRRFNWHDDGCSAPLEWVTGHWQRVFRRSCQRHDFGYRNFGNGLALGSNDATKRALDRRLRTDMVSQCGSYSGHRSSCLAAAFAFYEAVAHTGPAQTAFYRRACLPHRFCLFDDRRYGDRRVALSRSEPDLARVRFGDTTSSVVNRTATAWVVFDGPDYTGARYCLRPGRRVVDLGDYGFNDRASSAQPRSSASCPAGVRSIGR